MASWRTSTTNASANTGPIASNNVGLVNHSASTYLVDPKGRVLFVFAHGTSPEPMAKRLQTFVDE